MTGFTDLDLEKDGVGTFNLNRFRVAFRSTQTPQQLTQRLLTNFPGYFNSPAGTVTRQEGDKLKFFGNLPLPFKKFLKTPHPDWVRVVWTNPNHGFTVQTLHRDSIATDDFITAAGASVPGVLTGNPAAAIAEATRLNRYHFLAGRRGWRIDHASRFGMAGDGESFNPTEGQSDLTDVQYDMIFETAAIERSSSSEIELVKPLMTPLVVQIWTTMLMNFVEQTGVTVLPARFWPPEPKWAVNREVHYTWQQYDTLGQVLGTPDARAMQHLYPYIYQAPSD